MIEKLKRIVKIYVYFLERLFTRLQPFIIFLCLMSINDVDIILRLLSSVLVIPNMYIAVLQATEETIEKFIKDNIFDFY
jgi:hypothetical protein